MAKAINKAGASRLRISLESGRLKVKLEHPETKEPTEFTLAHAEKILAYQKKINSPAHHNWKFVEDQDHTLTKDGKIVPGTAK